MRVTQSGSNPIQNSEVAGAKGTGRAAGAQNKKSNASDHAESSGATDGAQAQISAKAREFAHAKEVASSAPDVREAKIAELRERIAAGKYHVDADKVADHMVDEHIKMSGH